jgi:hypothetical protein
MADGHGPNIDYWLGYYRLRCTINAIALKFFPKPQKHFPRNL